MNDVLIPEIVSATPFDKHYAIIGTRTPDDIQIHIANNLACVLSMVKRCKIKTGAADGIDYCAMSSTAPGMLEVYLPWKSYHSDRIPKHAKVIVYDKRLHPDWTASVSKYHPAVEHLTAGMFALHARNYGIVAGCAGVLAFPNEYGSGGTAQGIRIAKDLRIPVVQGNKGSIKDVALFMSNALKTFGMIEDVSTYPKTITGKTI